LKLGFSLLTGAPPYLVGAWFELSTPRKDTSWSGRGFLLRWCGDRERDLERLRRRRLGGGEVDAEGERVRCLRARMASGERDRLSSLDLSLRPRSRSRCPSRERERSRLLCLSLERSRLRSLSTSLSLERSRRLSLERSLVLPVDLSLLLSFDLSRCLSLERSLRRSFDLSRFASWEASLGRLYGSGDLPRPRLLALAAGEASLGLRSLERSLGFRSRDLLLDRRAGAIEGSFLACSGSLLATRSCTTRGGVGTSPRASCWVSSFLWLKGDNSLAMLRPLLAYSVGVGLWRSFKIVKAFQPVQRIRVRPIA
jgi:hypothetical protein